MKHFLIRCSLVVCLFLSLSVVPAHAAESYSHLYISISDAIMNTKQDKDKEATAALEQFQADWTKVNSTEAEAKATVDKTLAQAVEATSKEERLTALSALSNALRSLEKLENPVDKTAQRKEFATKFKPALADFEAALASGDVNTIDKAYKDFTIKWNKNERPVREQSIAMYGQIETQMSFMRISLSAEEPDVPLIRSQFEELKQTIEDFIAGKETAEVVEGEYSLATLIALIDEANDLIDEGNYKKASDKLREFIMVWPRVEIEVSTRNNGLYKKLESDMPILVSDLLKSDVDVKGIQDKLNRFKTEIELLQSDKDYTIWDSALILLREGLEALLIILALVSFLNKSGQKEMRKWIYVGAGVGIALSAVAAVLMSTIFNSATIDTNREVMEGYVGLLAAAMMIGVGIWLHSKSSVSSWNRYISKQMGQAISSGSIFAMASISFLSVFREGAETLVFYAGIAPKMETSQFVLGIIIAFVVLAIFALVLFKASGKIPISKFFAVATILIYGLAFKIIGVSLHTLQLTGKISTTVVDGIPTLNVIGLYPTVETLVGQGILLLLVVVTILLKRKQEK